MIRKCWCCITYKDGSRDIIECKLEKNQAFGLEEMEAWQKELSPEAIDQVICRSSLDGLMQALANPPTEQQPAAPDVMDGSGR